MTSIDHASPDGLPGGSSETARAATRRRHALEALVVMLVLGGVLVAGLVVIGQGAELSWDEAVYATKTRSFVSEVPASHWKLYRPPGLPALGLLAAPWGISEATLRIVATIASVAALAGAWALGRLLWGVLGGLVGLLVLVAAPITLREVAVFRNDLLSLTPILAVMVLLWWQLERRPAPNAALLLAAPLAAAAFYLRFGALAILVGIGLAALVLWARPLWQHRWLSLATIVLTLLLVAPHLVEAIDRTGSPLGIVTSAVVQVDTSSPLAAAIQYGRWLPLRIAGPAGSICLVVAALGAFVAAVRSWRRKRLTPLARRALFLLVPGIVAAVGTVMVSHAEARYLLPSLALGVIAGAGMLAVVWRLAAVRRRLPPTVRLVVIGGLVVGLLLLDGVVGRRWILHKSDTARDQVLAQAGRAIADVATWPCSVAATDAPVLGWYSRCLAVSFVQEPRSVDDPTVEVPERPDFVVVASTDGAAARRRAAERYTGLADSPVVATTGLPPTTVTIYRLSQP